jgi:hypothetical protein
MSLSSIDQIKDVVTSVQTAQLTKERDMYAEYQRSSKWLSEVAKVSWELDTLLADKFNFICIKHPSASLQLFSRLGFEEKDD